MKPGRYQPVSSLFFGFFLVEKYGRMTPDTEPVYFAPKGRTNGLDAWGPWKT